MTENEKSTLTKYDEYEHFRCPQLGDVISFSYCRRMNEDLPCRKMYDCWSDKLNVEEFLKENFSEEQIEKAFEPPKGRVENMFDILNRVLEEKKKQNTQQD